MRKRKYKWGKCWRRDVKGGEVKVEMKVVMEENGKKEVMEENGERDVVEECIKM